MGERHSIFMAGNRPTSRYKSHTRDLPEIGQVVELVGWSFFLSNLKSVAMKGPDLRNKNPRLSWKKGYID